METSGNKSLAKKILCVIVTLLTSGVAVTNITLVAAATQTNALFMQFIFVFLCLGL